MEPQVGDRVILHGEIISMMGGVALVRVDRTYPVGGTVAVQCGVLELDQRTASAADPVAAAEQEIATAMREAKAHPGRVVETGGS